MSRRVAPGGMVDAADIMPERDLQETVRQIALAHGWDYSHVHDSRHSPSGFPDVVTIHEGMGRGLVAELKREGEEPTAAQRRWLALFRAMGWETHVWRPRDLDEIQRLLGGR